MEHDLDIAGNLQSCLFPLSFPDFEKAEFAYRIRPYEKISGDFFEL
jgi:serine phosphatase RsbU (regulator of sigma subunit)